MLPHLTLECHPRRTLCKPAVLIQAPPSNAATTSVSPATPPVTSPVIRHSRALPKKASQGVFSSYLGNSPQRSNKPCPIAQRQLLTQRLSTKRVAMQLHVREVIRTIVRASELAALQLAFNRCKWATAQVAQASPRGHLGALLEEMSLELLSSIRSVVHIIKWERHQRPCPAVKWTELNPFWK